MANIPENTNYFSDVDSKGNSLGFSNLKDIMGTPYFAYRNPGDTATTTDLTRLATTFDPRVAQPLTTQMIDAAKNRLPEAVSSVVKQSLGGQYSDELDHGIANALLGSSNRANLRIIPGRDTSGNSTPDPKYGPAAKFDAEVDDLVHKVKTGQMSFFDAQLKIATDKKNWGDPISIPWTPNSPAVPPPKGQPIATTQQTSGPVSGQGVNPFKDIATKTDPTQSPATIPNLSDIMQKAIPEVQQTSSGHVTSGVRTQYNPNSTDNASDQAFANANKNSYNPNSNLQSNSSRLALTKEDHVIPLWAGGTDTADNIDTFDLPTYDKRQATFAVPLTLLANGLISKGQAGVMAHNAMMNGQDTSNVPKPDANGLIPLDAAKKVQQQWEEHDANPEPVTFSSVMKAFPKAMSNFGKGFLPDPIREFAKGLVGGGTAGLIPGTEATADEDTLSKLANFTGNVTGMFTGIGALGKVMEGAGLLGPTAKAARAGTSIFDYEGTGIKVLDNMMGYTKALNVAGDAAKAAGLVSKVVDPGFQKATSILNGTTMRTMAKSVGLLTAWNNVIGIGGKELTGQQKFDFNNHVKQFFTDVGYAGLLGSSAQSVKGYAGVGLGSTMISLIFGSNIEDALKNGALMTALHTMGYSKGNFDAKGDTFIYGGQLNQVASDQAYKMSAVTLDGYGQPIPTVKVGEGVPQVLKIPPETIDQLKAEWKQKNPTDTRFDSLENTNSAGAIQLMSQNAQARVMDMAVRSDGAISQDQIKQEMTRIVTAENALSNQTLAPEDRVTKQTKDLLSVGEKLKPQINIKQQRFVTNSSDIFNNTDFRKLGNKPNGNFALSGQTTIIGYGGTLDAEAKKTIDTMTKSDNYQKYVVGVSDKETIDFQKRVNQYISEVLLDPKSPDYKAYKELYLKGPTGDPNDTIRVFAMEKGVNGENDIPHAIGYMPKIDSYTKADNVNKAYREMVAAGHATSQVEYNSNLNTENIANEMRKNGKNYVIADISQLRPIGKGAKPNEPYIEINFTNRNVDSKPSVPFESSKPVSNALKANAEKSAAQNLSKTARDIMQKTSAEKSASQSTPTTPDFVSGLSKEEIKSLRKQGFSEKMIQDMSSKPVVEKPIVETYNEIYPPRQTSIPQNQTLFTETPKNDLAYRISTEANKEYPYAKVDEKSIDPVKNPDDWYKKFFELRKESSVSEKHGGITPEQYKLLKDPDPSVFSRSRGYTEKEISQYKEFEKMMEEGKKNNMFFVKDDGRYYFDRKPDGSPIFSETNQNTSTPEAPTSPVNESKAPETTQVSSQPETPQNNAENTPKSPSWTEFSPGIRNNIDSTNSKPDLVNEFYNDMVSRMEEIKPDVSSPKKHEESLMNIVKGFKRNNPGLSKEDFSNIMKDAKSRAEAYVRDTVDTAYHGTKVFGTDEDYVRPPTVDKEKDFPSPSEVLAKKYGLALTAPVENGSQFLKFNKSGSPIFLDPKAPRAFLESIFKKDIDIYKDNLSKGSQEWSKGLTDMQKLNDKTALGQYAKTWAKGLDTILGKKYNVLDDKGNIKYDWGGNWSLNSALKNFNKDVFTLSNEEGYSKSEPYRAIAAKNAGSNPEQIQKSLAKANAKTKAISSAAATARAEALGRDKDALTLGKGETEGMSGRIVDSNQLMNVAQDVTPFELMMNGIENADARSKLVTQYNEIRKELGGGSSQSNPKLMEQMKLLFDRVKAHSINIPDEVKTWKLGSPIVLKNGGAPTTGEAIKDAFNVGMKIISSGKSKPGSVSFKNIRQTVLDSIKPETKVSEGQGGPHQGQGGPGFMSNLYQGISGMFGSQTSHYVADSTPTPTQVNMPKFLAAIASNESSVVNKPYASSQYSNLKSLGNAMGKYRVTQGELKSYASRYLGRTVTSKEFQNSPQLQDAYMTGKVNYLSKLGYTPQQIADIHNKGMTNSSVPGSTQYQNPDYVEKFNSNYN